jgi:hypothetical protein
MAFILASTTRSLASRAAFLQVCRGLFCAQGDEEGSQKQIHP